ncbi:hypothetical protein DQ04_07101020 [Trypanosoma grayi]|uniref:hypothetical protein n=1 Tax=Trypanosoma grayi TaxID=71804 RepID=UPI0004F438C2|nr:hypothetical protein DQ04_07101020 [Trypanosoma grayi]KEG08475.1 hypothetical protein DQ04_07101020 [Trypanosoma grayi]
MNECQVYRWALSTLESGIISISSDLTKVEGRGSGCVCLGSLTQSCAAANSSAPAGAVAFWENFLLSVGRSVSPGVLLASGPRDVIAASDDTLTSGNSELFRVCLGDALAEASEAAFLVCNLAAAWTPTQPALDGDDALSRDTELLEHEKAELCDARTWLAGLRLLLGDTGRSYLHDEASLSTCAVQDEGDGAAAFNGRREQLQKALIDALQACDAERFALQEELRGRLTVTTEASPLEASLRREAAALREKKAAAAQKLRCLRDAVEEERRRAAAAAEEAAAAAALEEENIALQQQVEQCQRCLWERRQRTVEGGTVSLLTRCAFAAAKRDRLLQEVRCLSAACEREKAAQRALSADLNRVCAEATRANRQLRLLMAEKSVTMDLSREEHVQSSITATLRSALLEGAAIGKS